MSDKEPTPYAEITGRIIALEQSNAGLKAIVSYLEGKQASQGVPEITISHDQLADGTWRYKTSVTIIPENPEALIETLAWADEVARAEASRRESVDQAEGRTFSRARAPKALGSN